MYLSLFLQDQQVPFETIQHAPAFTAAKRAKFLHIKGRQLAKCVALMAGQRPVVAVLPATGHVDLQRVGRELAAEVRLATEDEFANLFTDCERGALTPFAHLYGATSILEDQISPDAWITFEAQRHGVSIRMRCRDFERLEKPRRFVFSSGKKQKSADVDRHRSL